MDSGRARDTTNNRMELRALLELLKATDPADPLHVQADSQYLINIFTKWLPGWRAKGMRRSNGKEVENSDLIKEIDRLRRGRVLTFQWVRGHAGHPLNEQADALANRAAQIAVALLDMEAEGPVPSEQGPTMGRRTRPVW
jgi:ribonuclease HI